MTKQVFVKPAEGRAVRDPVTYRLLKDEGETKPLDQYWQRRIRDADVEVSDPPAPEEPPAAEA
jgi:hypothetical protein